MPRRSIRPADPADASSLVDLLEQLGYPTAVNDIRARLKRLINAPDTGVLVAESAHELVGLAAFHIFDLIYRPRPQCRLTALVVHSRHRRRGVGTELVHAVEQLARESSCYRLELTTRSDRADAVPFYIALGFIERPHRLVKPLDDEQQHTSGSTSVAGGGRR